MDVSQFDYHLPEELIAQHPAQQRDQSRLLVVKRDDASLQEAAFSDLPSFLREGDLLVLNDTQVIPARLFGTKTPGGAQIEMLLLKPQSNTDWEVIAYRASRLKPGVQVVFSETLSCTVRETLDGGRFIVAFEWRGEWLDVLAQHGGVPLPPYIARDNGECSDEDRQRYQTIYARNQFEYNSPAAPTAGLHFTPQVFDALKAKGVETASVTLRVGLDTFLPMRVDRIEDHIMHAEEYDAPPETAEAVNRARREGRRVIAVGTTATRTLESAGANGELAAGAGSTRIYIYPGYDYKIVDAMITNFHLPKSTLLLMISAFMGNNLRERAYAHAVEHRFRFFSYGDAMVIL
ncbi:MAG: tRNA preQ1(34) S-adenosylmethionine ribosyltransferase-isomerase QueA [Candidatus Hinthialibacter antarcticus]|nr:tRNA preQ1(34) S-adenosylmethionine ribosyltransferase-isomerase QueA [Candidatus Hinthialibacter antarcticus]